jgi:hypothetical protein
MSDLLDDVIAAHGGLARWKAFATVQATIVTGGAFWGMKGLVQDPKPRLMRVKLHEEWSSVAPFGAPDMLTDFTPDRIAILKTDGAVVAERSNPREAFEGHDQKTPWDPLHRAYFNGYALWTYLTTPTAYRVIIDHLIASHRGRIFNTAGDSVLADFVSAVDAVECAVEIQDAIGKENADRPAVEKMHFRIGIHVGDIIVTRFDIGPPGRRIRRRRKLAEIERGAAVQHAAESPRTSAAA